MVNFEKTFVVEPRKCFEKEEKKKVPGFFSRKLTEFCQRTDLHGYKYIVMDGLSVVERGFWSLAMILSVAVAGYFVVTAYKWYARNPIVTVIESTHGPIWTVPFPAVTICDLNSISKKAAKNFAKRVKLPPNVTTDLIFEIVRYSPLLQTRFKSEDYQKKALIQLQEVLELNEITIKDFFTEVSPAFSCSKLVERCMWKHTIYRCDQLFRPIFTVMNLCCTFNYFAIDGDDEKVSKYFRMSSPRHVASCGYQTALTVLLKTDPGDYYSADVASRGFLVFVEDPYSIPDLDSPMRIVNPQSELLIALSPERTYSTPGIKSFTPNQRQCYYHDEIKLGKFRKYSFHNCAAYKKVELIKRVCKCIPFFFPYKGAARDCNFYDMECLETLLVADDASIERSQMKSLECLSECEHYDYPLEVALGMLTNNVNLNRIAFYNDISLVNRSVLNVFFNDLVSTRYRRDVYLNWQNILASFGGLLSLMLGFTLISGFDIIIFFIFRIVTDLFKKNNVVVSATKIKHNLPNIKRTQVY